MQGFQCQIRVKGHLSPDWSNWFEGMTITNEPLGNAVLSGTLVDDAALYGVLMKMRDTGLTVLALKRDSVQEVDTQ